MRYTKNKYPNTVRRHRTMAGLSYKSLAALLGIKNPRAISRWEKGFTMPSAIHLLKLSYLFRTFPQQLYAQYYQEMGTDAEENWRHAYQVKDIPLSFAER